MFDEEKLKEYVRAYVALQARHVFEDVFHKLRVKSNGWGGGEVLKTFRVAFDLSETEIESQQKKVDKAQIRVRREDICRIA